VKQGQNDRLMKAERQGVVRILKLGVFLLLLAGVGLVAFAYLGDLTPQQSETRLPVTLDGS
jgi:hypothetical protein